MGLLSESVALPVPESSDLGRYLEDTITIDWQTPAVSACARRLQGGAASGEDGIERLFRFVRDEIAHTFDLESEGDLRSVRDPASPRDIACSASDVLRIGHGLCYAKSHLLAALLRHAGHPTGFCYVRLVDDERPGRFVLHGFNAVYWSPSARWVLLDARGNRPGITTECRLEPPYSLAYLPDAAQGESLLPVVFKRPGRRVIDALERAPDRAALKRTLPDRVD